MDKLLEKKKVNIDCIPVVRQVNSMLEYVEIEIDKNNQELISLIEDLLKNDDKSLFETQNTFSEKYTGSPIGYSYCLPHSYSEAFVDSAEYPKMYSQKEYNEELIKIRDSYIDKESETIAKQKEDGIISEDQYDESLNLIKEEAEELVKERISTIRNDFVQKSRRYIDAVEFYSTLKAIKAEEKNVMYSTEIIGFTNFNYKISNDIAINLRTNFCYGRSAYFHVTLLFKGVKILSYPKLIRYYYANMYDFIDCTESYKTERDNWKHALSFVVEQSNWAHRDEDAFVQKWIIDGTKEMVDGLNRILNSPKECLEELISNDLDENHPYTIRNITKEEITDYKIYPDEMTIAFQAEKIAGSLLLLPNLQKLCEFYDEINTIINDIEIINKAFFPILNSSIIALSVKIKNKQEELCQIKDKYQAFRKKNSKSFNDYRVFVYKNSWRDYVYEDYISLHPEHKIVKEHDDVYNEMILSLENETKRLNKFHRNLTDRAQLICDYDLSDITSDLFLQTSVSRGQSLLSVTEGNFVMSKDRRRLFKHINNQQLTDVIIPESVRVICENSFINNNTINKITFPKELLKIGQCAFNGCHNLLEVILPNTVAEIIGSDCFSGCKSLKKVVLSSSLKEIPRWFFSGCDSLSDLVIPESIKIIGDGAFDGCKSLRSIRIPDSIEEVGKNIFEGCNSLKYIYVLKRSKEKYEKLFQQYKDKLVGVNSF